MSNDSERRRHARHLRARRAPPVREHAVALRHHHEPRHLEAPAELAVLHHERALPLRRREMRRETRPRRLQQFRAPRGLRAELRETRQRRTLERPLRHARRRRHSREDLAETRIPQKRMRKTRVGIVVHPEDCRTGGQDVEETRLLARRHGDGREFRRRDLLHGGLQRRVELAQRLEVLAEVLRSYGTRRAGRPGVEHAAAYGVLPHGRDLARAFVAGCGKTRLHLRERACGVTRHETHRCGTHRRGVRHARQERRTRRHDDERIRMHPPRAKRSRHPEARGRGRRVVLERRRETKRAHAALALEDAQVVRHRIRLRDARRDRQHERRAALPWRTREYGGGERRGRTGERRQSKHGGRTLRPLLKGLLEQGESLARLLHGRYYTIFGGAQFAAAWRNSTRRRNRIWR